MAFCGSCGREIRDGQKYCSHCGAEVVAASTCKNCGRVIKANSVFCPYCGKDPNAKEQTHKPRYVSDTESKESEGDKSKRTIEFAGTIRKCPHCGEVVSSYAAICPTCKHELNNATVAHALQPFIESLQECDERIAAEPAVTKQRGWKSWSGGKRFWWIILNIITLFIPLIIYCGAKLLGPSVSRIDRTLSAREKEKSSLIKNFVVPNDRASILAALDFAKQKMQYLAEGHYNPKDAYWGRLWAQAAKQFYQKATLLLDKEPIADKTYQDIQNYEQRILKKSRSRVVAGFILILLYPILAILGLLILKNNVSCESRKPINFNSCRPINCGASTSQSTTNHSSDKKEDKESISDTMPIRNYIGKNVASIGKVDSNGTIYDEYGIGKLELILAAENGLYLNPKDQETLKGYTVTDQSIAPGTTMTLVHQTDSRGRPYSSLLDYQSYEVIVLYVTPINGEPYSPVFTEVLPVVDRHVFYIRDYIGLNAASFGKENSRGSYDNYGETSISIKYSLEDGSYFDNSDPSILNNYVVVNQDVAVNSELNVTYDKDSRGKEYYNLIQSQSIEVIYLTIAPLDAETLEIMAQMPVITPEPTSVPREYMQLKYKVLTDGTAEITGCTGEGNAIKLESSLDGHEVVRIADNAFKGNTALEYVDSNFCKIPEIGESAFQDCTSLIEINLPYDCVKINDYAFKGCSALTSISFGNDIETIGAHAFENCTSLTSIVFWGDPDIGDYAFAGCTALPSVSIGYRTKRVGAHAFDGCTDLSSVQIWNDETIIEKDAFKNCPKLNRPVQD